MKVTFRYFFGAVMAICIGLAFGAVFSASAHAAPVPEAVTNATGTVVYGTHTALAVKKDTATGKTLVRYQTGWQLVNDDASYSKYAKFVTAIGNRGLAVDSDPASTVYAIASATAIYCVNGQTLIAFEGQAPDYLADGCGFWAKAKANSN